MSENVAEMTGTEMQTQLIRARTMTDEMRWILGRPNFACCNIAQLLRRDGQEIDVKSEAEQAAVIHWMLCLYMQHGDEFRGVIQSELIRISENLKEKDSAGAN